MLKNIIIGQSGGPTVAINSSLAGLVHAAKTSGVKNIYGMVHGIQGLLQEETLDLNHYIPTDLELELLKRTPASFLGSCRIKLPTPNEDESIYKKIFSFIDSHQIDAFFYIGGNDSMDTIDKLSAYGESISHPCRFIGCPKTVDNDLAHTDHTPGYGSAAKYIATSVKEVVRDSMCQRRKEGQALIIEIMGRSAGWLTAASALARGDDGEGPDFIYLPERVFNVDKFINQVTSVLEKKSNVTIAVSEGIKTADGKYVCELGASSDFVDAFGHKQLSGTGLYLAGLLEERVGCKPRAIELSTLQRSASHLASATDLEEGFQAGVAAFEQAALGVSGAMITFERTSDYPYKCITKAHDISQIANEERCVPDSMISDDATDVTDEFLIYARPLILGEVNNLMVNGVPRHLPIPKELY